MIGFSYFDSTWFSSWDSIFTKRTQLMVNRIAPNTLAETANLQFTLASSDNMTTIDSMLESLIAVNDPFYRMQGALEKFTG